MGQWAHGYDPSEPLNTEEIRVKLREGGQTALVSYRNRVTEVNVPPHDATYGLGGVNSSLPAPSQSA